MCQLQNKCQAIHKVVFGKLSLAHGHWRCKVQEILEFGYSIWAVVEIVMAYGTDGQVSYYNLIRPWLLAISLEQPPQHISTLFSS